MAYARCELASNKCSTQCNCICNVLQKLREDDVTYTETYCTEAIDKLTPLDHKICFDNQAQAWVYCGSALNCSNIFYHPQPDQYGILNLAVGQHKPIKLQSDALIKDTCNHFHGYDWMNMPIYECNESSSCGKNCSQRVVQHGSIWHFQVFDCVDTRKRYGLRCPSLIPKGAFVVEYAGEIISTEEAERRHERRLHQLQYSASSKITMNYVFTVHERAGKGNDSHVYSTCVDATHFGNASRYINHSCEPCLESMTVRISSSTPHIALFAKRDIRPFEELTFDYGSVHADCDKSSGTNCLCGTALCRGKLPTSNTV